MAALALNAAGQNESGRLVESLAVSQPPTTLKVLAAGKVVAFTFRRPSDHISVDRGGGRQPGTDEALRLLLDRLVLRGNCDNEGLFLCRRDVRGAARRIRVFFGKEIFQRHPLQKREGGSWNSR